MPLSQTVTCSNWTICNYLQVNCNTKHEWGEMGFSANRHNIHVSKGEGEEEGGELWFYKFLN